MVTLTEALQILQVSRSTMYRLIKSGRIRPIRYSTKGYYRFDKADLTLFIIDSKQNTSTTSDAN